MLRLTVGALMALRALLRDKSGAVAIIVVFALPVLVGFTGLAIDVSYWYLERRELRTAADAAAVAGSLEVANGNPAGVDLAARTDAGRNGVESICIADPLCVVVNNPPKNGPNVGNAFSVEVIISQELPLFFSGIFLSQGPEIQARAVANAVQVQEQAFCFVSLDPAAANAVTFSGVGAGSTQAQLTGCGIKVNSTDPSALFVRGNATLVVSQIPEPISIVGNLTTQGNPTVNTQGIPIETGAPPAPDPFEDLEVPTDPAFCTSTDAFGNPLPNVINATITLAPGRYCGGLNIAGANVTLQPGNYIVDGGNLSIQGGASLQEASGGGGVTFVLTNTPASTGTQFAQLQIGAGSSLQLKAPTAGDLAGILFFQDRLAPSGVNDINLIAGGSTIQTDGSFYFPSQEIRFTGGSQVQVDSGGCIGLVGRALTLLNTQLQLTCDPTSPNAVLLPSGPLGSRLGE